MLIVFTRTSIGCAQLKIKRVMRCPTATGARRRPVGPLPRAGGSPSTHQQAGGASGEVCRGPGCGDRPPGPLCPGWCSAGSGPLVGGRNPGRAGRSVVELFRGGAPRGNRRPRLRRLGPGASCWWRRPWVAAPSAAPGRTAVVAIDHPLHFGHRAAGRAESTADNGLDTKDHQPPCGAPRAVDRWTRVPGLSVSAAAHLVATVSKLTPGPNGQQRAKFDSVDTLPDRARAINTSSRCCR